MRSQHKIQELSKMAKKLLSSVVPPIFPLNEGEIKLASTCWAAESLDKTAKPEAFLLPWRNQQQGVWNREHSLWSPFPVYEQSFLVSSHRHHLNTPTSSFCGSSSYAPPLSSAALISPVLSCALLTKLEGKPTTVSLHIVLCTTFLCPLQTKGLQNQVDGS